ncbi:MAG: peptidase [Nitrospira sp.]|nr:MAG: peptidase [Nitrospira sp.]
MRNNGTSAGLLAALGCVALFSLSGCPEIQRVAEQAARQSGDERLARAIHGTGQVIGGLLPIGPEEEENIGQAIALQVIARYGGVYGNLDLTRYVNLVGKGVALTCDRANMEYRFAVLNHDSINAFAAPSGYIFVTRGLLNAVQNEAELAAVLGHEIGHVTQKHILDVIQRSKQISGVAEAGLAYASRNPDAFKNVIDGAVKKLLDEGLDQGKELESDRLGVVFASRVGYDPSAYLTFLNRLRQIKGDDRAFFKTHPNFSNRINVVQNALRVQGVRPGGALLADRFSQRSSGKL